MASGPRLQVEQVSTDDSSRSLNVVFDEASGSIAIDYSPFYERIATAMESVATSITSIQGLAEGNGIRVVTPYEWVTLISIYKLLIEEDKLVNGTRELTETERAEAQERISSYLAKVQEFFPPTF